MSKKKGHTTIDQEIVGAPGYLPLAQRPCCHVCAQVLRPYIERTRCIVSNEQGVRYDTAIIGVKYGHRGCGVFCSKSCGFRFGEAAAIRFLHLKARRDGSSGNVLIDTGVIKAPEDIAEQRTTEYVHQGQKQQVDPTLPYDPNCHVCGGSGFTTNKEARVEQCGCYLNRSRNKREPGDLP